MEEVWLPISGFEKNYRVSNFGRIKSLKRKTIRKDGKTLKIRERIMKLATGNHGYKKVVLQKNKTKTYRVHRLVATAFISNPENKPCVNHKNGIKTDNRVENLEWCTQKENINHAINTGLIKYKRNSNIKNRPKQKKLNQKQVDEIRKKYIPWKYSTYKLAKEYFVSAEQIHNIVTGVSWKDSYSTTL